MAISTLAGLKAGMRPSKTELSWSDLTMLGGYVSNPTFSILDRAVGKPCPASPALANGPSGTALTSLVSQIPMPIPVEGQSIYVAGLEAFSRRLRMQAVLLYDRLWHSGPFVNSTNNVQAVGSVAWPARDINESTDGAGVHIALICHAISSSPFMAGSYYTMSYTNSEGVSGRMGVTRPASTGSSTAYMMIQFCLDVGDVGVRSVESISFVGTPGTNANVELMAFRLICRVPTYSDFDLWDKSASAGCYGVSLAVPLGMPKVFDNSVVLAAFRGTGISGPDAVNINVQWAQG